MPEGLSWITAARNGLHISREFSDGAVLIDLETGDLIQLNRTGAFIHAHVARGIPTYDIVGPLSDRFGISMAQAHSDVSSFLATSPKAVSVPPVEDPSPFEYVPAGESFAVRRSNAPLLYVHGSGQWVNPATDGQSDAILAALVWALPKIVVLQGHPVLHASAVAIEGRAVAFSGRSGAGKTTVARAFADGGAPLLAEDAVLIQRQGVSDIVRLASLDGCAYEWAHRALLLAPQSDGRIACDLRPILGESHAVPIAELMFLDSRRRHGRELSKVPLGETARMVALLQNLFWASNDLASYQRGFDWSASISRSVPASALTVPAGISQLSSAARAYVENTAS